MKTLAFFQVPKTFDSIIMLQNSYGQHQTVTHHVDCEHTFTTLWPEKYICGCGYIADGALDYYCPSCGAHSNGYHSSICIAKPHDIIPTEIEFSVLEYKDYLDLVFRYRKVIVTTEDIIKSPVVDVSAVRFDFKNQQALHIINYRKKREVEVIHPDNPFRVHRYISAILNALNYQSLCHEYKRDLQEVVLILRKAFARKLEKKVRYKINGLYTPLAFKGSEGFCTRQLATLVWRLNAPDAFSLTSNMYASLSHTGDAQYPIEVFRRTSEGMSFVDAVINVYAYQYYPFLRKYITRNQGLKDCLWLVTRIFKNKDNIRQLLNFYDKNQHICKQILTSSASVDLAVYLQDLIAHKNEKVAVGVLTKSDISTLRDIYSMYVKLTEENKKIFWSKKIRTREHHDELVYLFNRQEHGEIEFFELPQLEGLHRGFSFEVVRNAGDLMTVGKLLHNCVGSYKDRVLKREVAIVTIREKGHYIACLELRMDKRFNLYRKLAQAKLDRNETVDSNPAINAAVVEWAQIHELEVQTEDVRIKAIAS